MCEISWIFFINFIDYVFCLNGVDWDVFVKCGFYLRFLVNGGICFGFCLVDLFFFVDLKEFYVWFSVFVFEMNGFLMVMVCVFDEFLFSEVVILMFVVFLVLDCVFLF